MTWEVTRHSPSSLNLYRANPAAWLLRYGYHVKSNDNPWAILGLAMEHALAIHIGAEPKPSDIQNIILSDIALLHFESIAQGQADSEWEKARGAIPFIAERLEKVAHEYMEGFTNYQMKLEGTMDGCSLPILGYTDFNNDHSEIIDIKIKKSMPSKPAPDHIRQQAIYAKLAKTERVGLVYVSAAERPKNETMIYWLTPDDIEKGWRDMCQAARAVETMMQISGSPEKLAQIIAPNWDDFRFGEAEKAKAMEIWA